MFSTQYGENFPRFVRCNGFWLALLFWALAVGPRAATAFTSPVDDLGRPVPLAAPAKRVVCIGPGATETIFALGAGGQLVGRDQFSDFPAGVNRIPIAGDFTGPYAEQVVALRADLIVVQGETFDAGRADLWARQCNAPVAILAPRTLPGLETDFRKLGAWLGRADQARALAAGFSDALPRAKPRLAAFIEVERTPLMTAGLGTFLNDAVSRVFINVAVRDYQLRGYQAFNLENLIASQPGIYVVPSFPGSGAALSGTLRQLRSNPVLSKLKCVQSGRVIVIDGDFIERPGPRLAQGIALLARQAALFPDQ